MISVAFVAMESTNKLVSDVIYFACGIRTSFAEYYIYRIQ